MLRAKHGFVVGVIAVSAIGVALAVDKRPDSPGPGSSSEELVAAAREAYEARMRQWPIDPEHVHLDDIYHWSKRWMTAEWDLNLHSGESAKGAKTHLKRMVDLERTVVDQQKMAWSPRPT